MAPAGAGKSTLAKELAGRNPELFARVPVDYFFVPRPKEMRLDQYLAQPLEYDWSALDEALASTGPSRTTPDCDVAVHVAFQDGPGSKFAEHRPTCWTACDHTHGVPFSSSCSWMPRRNITACRATSDGVPEWRIATFIWPRPMPQAWVNFLATLTCAFLPPTGWSRTRAQCGRHSWIRTHRYDDSSSRSSRQRPPDHCGYSVHESEASEVR